MLPCHPRKNGIGARNPSAQNPRARNPRAPRQLALQRPVPQQLVRQRPALQPAPQPALQPAPQPALQPAQQPLLQQLALQRLARQQLTGKNAKVYVRTQHPEVNARNQHAIASPNHVMMMTVHPLSKVINSP
jgi:hypothetical protein